MKDIFLVTPAVEKLPDGTFQAVIKAGPFTDAGDAEKCAAYMNGSIRSVFVNSGQFEEINTN